MGLGLLAAGGLAGLGQAGMAASSMVLKSELDKEERDWLQQRAEQMQIAREGRAETAKIATEQRAVDRVAKERGDVAEVIGGVQLPEGATEKDRALAVAAAMQGKGRLDEGNHFYKRAKDIEKNDIEEKRYDATVSRDDQRFKLQNAREDRMAASQAESVRLQRAASGRADEDQKFQRKDRDDKEKATGMLAGYKIAKARGLDDAADVYLEQSMGLGVDPRMIDKNDPLSSQVSAAKATLGSMDSSKEQKAEALRVLDIANKAFNDRKTPLGDAAKQPVTVKGQIIGYATTQAEANQMVQAHLKK